MVIDNIPKQKIPKDETTRTSFTTLEEIIAYVEGKTQGKSARPESPVNNLRIEKPSVKLTPPMETSKGT
jgi:hypothetical protein